MWIELHRRAPGLAAPASLRTGAANARKPIPELFLNLAPQGGRIFSDALRENAFTKSREAAFIRPSHETLAEY